MVGAPLYLAAIVDFRFAALIEDGTHWTDRPTPRNHAEAMDSQYAEEWRVAEAKERRALEERDVLGELRPDTQGEESPRYPLRLQVEAACQ